MQFHISQINFTFPLEMYVPKDETQNIRAIV